MIAITHTRSLLLRVACCAATALLCIPSLPAQDEKKEGEKKSPSTSEDIDQRFDAAFRQAQQIHSYVAGKVITLDEALRITLARQPSIRLSEEDLEIAKAAVLLAAAPFDLTALADLSHGRTYLPRTPAQLRQEIAQRMQAQLDAQRRVQDQQSEVAQSAVSLANATNLTNQALLLDILGGTFPALTLPAATSGAGAQGLLTAQQVKLAELQNQLANRVDPPLATRQRIDQTNYSVGASKLTRSGIILNPRLDFNRNEIENTGSVNLDLNIPLGQGRGAITQRAAEDAAIIDMEASKWSLRHEISNALVNTAIAYWNLVAAQQDFALLRSSESLARTFDDLSAMRLQEEEISEGEAAIARSRLANSTTQRIIAEFGVYNARQQLALAMGLEDGELDDPPFAAGDLPTATGMGNLAGVDHDSVRRKALLLRDDQRAAVQLVRSGKILATAAKFDQKPIVDLFFQFAFTGVNEGTHFSDNFSAFGDETTGAGAFGGITMQWPLKLSAARAAYQQSAAIFRQRRISALDLERFIASGVNLAMAEALSSRQQVAAAERASDYSGRALEAERAKYNAGESTLLDSIQLEEQFTFSQRNLIIARLSHAVAVSRLRFESGTLLDTSAEYTPGRVSFNSANLTRIPNWSALPSPPIDPVEVNFDAKPMPLLKRRRIARPQLTFKEQLEAEARAVATDKEVTVKGRPTAWTRKPRSENEVAIVEPAPAPERKLLPVSGVSAAKATKASKEREPKRVNAAEKPSRVPKPATRAQSKPQPLLKKVFGGRGG